MNNVNPIMQQALAPFIKPVSDEQVGGLPVVSFADKWRESRPCIVERDGLWFIHDPEVARRTNQFFGAM